MKYYIMFGPPGAGKGTHAVAIREKYNLCHISTGELLRAEIAAGTELGLQAKTLIDNGNLVPDEVVEKMIAAKFDSVKNVDGFLLDGFPRTLRQAEDLDKILAARNCAVDAVISLMISDEVVKQRIAHRAALCKVKPSASTTRRTTIGESKYSRGRIGFVFSFIG